MEASVNFKMLSLNVRGIRSLEKRKAVLIWLNKQNADIIYLQETYSTKEIENIWRCQWKGPIFFAHGTNRSCGVLRATAYKYEEYGDRSKISDFILFHLKDPFGEPFSKITLKLSIALSFLGKIEKLKKRVDGRLTPLKNNVKSCNLKRFVRSND